MKQKILSAALVVLVLLGSCNKPDRTETSPVPQAAKMQYGVSVKEGRLHFATINDFKIATEFVGKEREKFDAYVLSLQGFTSKAESKKGTLNKSECNCELYDDYANALIDDHYLMEIGDWTVKLNGCNDRYYALYKRSMPESEIVTHVYALQMCDFSTSHHFYEISRDLDLAEELSIWEEIFAGNPNAGERRCRDVVCSDRMDVTWADSYNSWGSVWITIPECRLHYNKGWLNHGAVTIYAFDDGTDNFFQNKWFYEIYDSQFKEKCGSYRTLSAQSKILFDSHGNWDGNHPGTWWKDRIYEGPRLKAGEGSIQVRVKHPANKLDPDHNFYWETDLLENVF